MVEYALLLHKPIDWNITIMKEDDNDDFPWFCVRDIKKGLGYKGKVKTSHPKKILTETTSGRRPLDYVTESELYLIIAHCQLLTDEQKEKTIKAFQERGYLKNIVLSTRAEMLFIDMLVQVLRVWGIKGQKQYKCGKYKIDYYIPSLKLAIEYDENNHSGYSFEEQEGRQKYIENRFNCKFVRLSDTEDNITNLGIALDYVVQNRITNEKNRV